MRRILVGLVTLAALTLIYPVSDVQAQTQTTSQVLGDIKNILFEEAERRAIEEYYKRFPSRVPQDGNTPTEDTEEKAEKDKSKKGKGKGAKGKGRGNGLPPGLAKRDQLPPGLAKRGNQLPPGLMKGDLPPDLEKELPELPNDVERVTVDNDVLLIQRGTNLILDVIEGVLRQQ